MQLQYKEIAQGIKNKIKEKLGVADEATLTLASQRLDTCKDCKSFGYNKLFSQETCEECGCIIHLKILSDSTCPLLKW
jgi:DnaJ-class molecular chaperone